jgi:hypothetical protein
MTNVSALPKSDIVSAADLARPARSAIARRWPLRATAKPALAMAEVASAEGDLPLGVTGKSLKRYLRDKYHDPIVYLGDRRVQNLATSAALT